jgi:F-type H+-transporting ATPase subunit b
MELLKLLSANEIVAQTVAFLVLLWILRKVFWNKFLKLIDDRRQRIASELKLVEDARSETERTRRSYEEKLGNIEETSRARMQEIIAEGRRIADEIRENASRDGEKIVENARTALKADIIKAKEELKDEMVDLVIDTAGKIIGEKLSEGEDKKLVEFFLREAEPGK